MKSKMKVFGCDQRLSNLKLLLSSTLLLLIFLAFRPATRSLSADTLSSYRVVLPVAIKYTNLGPPSSTPTTPDAPADVYTSCVVTCSTDYGDDGSIDYREVITYSLSSKPLLVKSDRPGTDHSVEFTSYVYDEGDAEVMRVIRDRDGGVLAMVKTERFPDGLPIRRLVDSDGDSRFESITKYFYDRGRLVKILSSSNGETDYSEQFVYDAGGNLVRREVDYDGNLIYDTRIDYVWSRSTLDRMVWYNSMQSLPKTLYFVYNDLDLLVAEDLDLNSDSEIDQRIEYDYDSNGLVSSVTDLRGKTIETLTRYWYDDKRRLLSQTTEGAGFVEAYTYHNACPISSMKTRSEDSFTSSSGVVAPVLISPHDLAERPSGHRRYHLPPTPARTGARSAP